MVMLDSCRADKFGALGGSAGTTPRFDELARDSDALLFPWHFAQAPHTKASTASLFSGTLPFQHGVIVDDLLAELELRSGRYREMSLSPSFSTLAEALQAAGWATFAAVRIGHLTEKAGFAQGFDRFVQAVEKLSDRRSIESALEFLEGSARPGFAYVHVRACHNPFPDESRDAELDALLKARFDEVAFERAGIDPGSVEFKPRVRSGALKLSSEQVAYLHAVYEAVLHRVDDRLVGWTVGELRRRGLYDRTLLAFSADHGEELLDHGGYAHGHSVWNEVTHVPLLVKLPRGSQRPDMRGKPPTQAIDWMPSLLRFLGLTPPAGSSSADLFGSGARAERIFLQAPGSWAIVEWPWKLVVSTQAEGAARLFDLAIDPDEQHDLSSREPGRTRALLAAGRQLQRDLPRVRPSTLPPGTRSEQEIEELRSLGYLH